MHIICRKTSVLTLDLSPILAALTKVVQKEISERINSRIAQLLEGAEDIPMTAQEYERIRKELEDLERQRREYRILRKVRYATIHAILHGLWLNRVRGASRSLAKLTFDPMSITMPVPPTFKTSKCSLGCGRTLHGVTC